MFSTFDRTKRVALGARWAAHSAGSAAHVTFASRSERAEKDRAWIGARGPRGHAAGMSLSELRAMCLHLSALVGRQRALELSAHLRVKSLHLGLRGLVRAQNGLTLRLRENRVDLVRR